MYAVWTLLNHHMLTLIHAYFRLMGGFSCPGVYLGYMSWNSFSLWLMPWLQCIVWNMLFFWQAYCSPLGIGRKGRWRQIPHCKPFQCIHQSECRISILSCNHGTPPTQPPSSAPDIMHVAGLDQAVVSGAALGLGEVHLVFITLHTRLC